MPQHDTDVTVVIVCGELEMLSWSLAGSQHPDLGVVEDLARLALALRGSGCSFRLRGTGVALSELLDLVGLTGVLPGAVVLREVGGKAECREQAGVDEVVVPDDPVA
ncbi:MAG: hypothetical protein M3Z83_07455 [Actinomycetota bacterium]|nr:hypothetical protein [Actinomycetota bacterium]